MLLLGVLFLIVLAPAILGSVVAKILEVTLKYRIFRMTVFMLPTIVFLGSLSLLIYFLSIPHDPSDGGDGPAFFGMLVIMIIGPPVLIIPGFLSGWLALSILRMAGWKLHG